MTGSKNIRCADITWADFSDVTDTGHFCKNKSERNWTDQISDNNKNIPVKAKNPADAVATVKSLYLNEVIVLDSGDYLMTEYYFNGDKVC